MILISSKNSRIFRIENGFLTFAWAKAWVESPWKLRRYSQQSVWWLKSYGNSSSRNSTGDSDVGDIVMLVTLWWWLIWDVGGRIIMLATFCVMLVIFSMYEIGMYETNILNRSPTSQTCHQHILSPTSVTNIDVTIQPTHGYVTYVVLAQL